MVQSVVRRYSARRWENLAFAAFAVVAILAGISVRVQAKENSPSPRKSPDRASRTAPHAVSALKPAPRKLEVKWLERNDFIKSRAGLPAEVILLGDSITQGWNYKNHWDEYFPRISAVNAGITSDRVEHVLWRTRDGLFSRARPKVVILLAGINNLATNDPKQIAATQAATIQEILAHSPSTKILLLAVFPSGASPAHARRPKISRLNSHLAHLADGRRVHYLDIGNDLLEADGTLSKAVSFDSLHLTSRGYGIWAKAMAPKLHQLLGSSGA